MPRDWRVLVAILVVLGVIAGPADGATSKTPPKLVTVIGALPVVIDVDDPQAAQRVPIRLGKGVKATQLKIRILLARYGANRNANLIKRFTATLDPRAAPVAIQIAARTHQTVPALRPGRYRLVLGLRQGNHTQRLALTVRLPSVVLRTDPPFKVQDRVGVALLSSIPLDSLHDHVGPNVGLVLDPSSTSLTNVTIATVTQPNDGSIEFDSPGDRGTNLAPGATLVLTPKIDGVPPGTYTGKVEVHADQLGKPITFHYVVDVKRNGWWIVVLVAGGFLAGLVVRKGLGALIGWLQAVRAAQDYAAELGGAAAVAADDGFRARLVAARNTLLHEIGGLNARSKINDAVTKARASWTAAVREYETAHAEQSAQLETLGKALPDDTGIELIDTTIAAARGHAEQAAILLGGSDPTRAATQITTAERLLKTTLRERVGAWSDDANSLLDAVLDAPVVDPTSLDALVTTARAALAAIDADGATIAERLSAANAALPPLRHVVRETRSDAHTLATEALDLISSSSLGAEGRPDPDALRRRLANLEGVLRQASVGEDGALSEMANALGALSRELITQAIAWSPLPNAAALVAQKKIIAALTPPPVQAYAELGDGPDQGGAPAADGTSVDRGSAPAGEARTATKPPSPATGAAPAVPAFWVSVGSGLNWAALIIVYGVRIIVLTVLFSVIGWLAYHEHFVGTTQEMVGIFLWAFTTDLTIEGITQMAVQRKQAPATSAPSSSGL